MFKILEHTTLLHSKVLRPIQFWPFGLQFRFKRLEELLITISFHVYFTGMVDVIFADVAQPDQARIVAINAHHFLKTGGHVVISIKVSRFSLHNF